MGKLCFKTRNGVSPQGKPRVYFTCHKEDFEKYFEEISDMILKEQNCAVYYYDDADSVMEEEKELDLSQMQLFVIPVTENFLGRESSAFDYDFKYATEHHIPVLPILNDGKLTELFNQKCGNIQYLLKNDNDETAISFEVKFENFLSSVLVGDELAAKIRAAFDAYVFLSYRKKDRKYAQELMRLIHKNDFCRDIAIWYDEFLVPGENFNDAISEAMQKSKLFALVVTPNLVNEENYVMTTEYPMAQKNGMPMLPAEAVETDKALLKEKFEGIPDCTNIHNGEELASSLYEGLKNIAVRTNDTSPEHNFFIGLAYLSGIDVEVDHEKAVNLITFAAEGGLGEAAKKLANMYKIGEGVPIDYDNAIKWQQKYCEILKAEWEKSSADDDGKKYLYAKQELYNLYADLERHEEVIKIATELGEEGKKIAKNDNDAVFLLGVINRLARSQRRLRKYDEAEENYKGCIKAYELLEEKYPGSYGIKLSTIYNNLAYLYKDLKRFDEAEEIYLKAKEIREKKNEERPGVYDSDVALIYGNLGALYYAMKKYGEAEKFYNMEIEIRERLAKTEKDAELDSLGTAYSSLADVFENTERYGECENLRLKALEIREKLAKKNPVLFEASLVSSYSAMGYLYRVTERYAKAEKMYLEAYRINERRKNENPVIFEPSYAGSCQSLGVLYNRMRKYDKAEEYFKKAIEIREKLYGESPQVYEGGLSGSYAQAAHNLRALKRLDEAEELYIKAIEVNEKRNSRNEGVYENDLATAYGNLGILYREKRIFGKAEELFLKALKLKEKLAKENAAAYESTLALWYHETAIFYLDAGRRKKEIEYLLKALEIKERLAKENAAVHEVDISLYCGRLATAYRKEKRYDEAEEMHMKALTIRERLWRENPEVHEGNLATCYNNIAIFYKETDKTKYKLAEEYYLKCIAIREEQVKKFPEIYSGNLKTAYSNMAYLYKEEGRHIEATNYFRKAGIIDGGEDKKIGNIAGIGYGIMEIAEGLCNVKKDGALEFLKNILAFVLYKVSFLMQEWACNKRKGVFENDLIKCYESFINSSSKFSFKNVAEKIYLKKIKLREKQCKADALKYENELAKDLNKLGGFYEERGQNKKAVSAYKRGIKIREKACEINGVYKEFLARDYNNLGLCLKMQKNYKEAEGYYLAAVKINEKLGPERKGSLAINYYNLGYLYYATGNTAKEAEFFEKAAVLYRELATANPEKYAEDLKKTEECLENVRRRLD